MDKPNLVTVEDCRRCDGEGYIGNAPSPLDPVDTSSLCPDCKGSGYVLMDSAGRVIGPARVEPLVVCTPPAPF